MPVSDDDWRLTSQGNYLRRRPLRRRRWTPYRPGWDHDHCEFCWAKFGNHGPAESSLDEGYVTSDDDYHWICVDCFEDFKERFEWTVTEGD